MPTEQPSSAPDAVPTDQRDELTAAAVLHDDQMDDAPGGGGLGGAAAPIPAGGEAAGRAGAATPNLPIDAPVPHGGGGDGKAQAEALTRAVDDLASDPGSSSR